MLDAPLHAALAEELQRAESTHEQVEQFSRRYPAMEIADSYAIQRECGAAVLNHPGNGVAWLANKLAPHVCLGLEVVTAEGEIWNGLRGLHKDKLLESALEQGLATDAALSISLAQFRALWALREDICESQGAEGKTIKHDISLPISRIPEFMANTGAALEREFPGQRPIVFGHLGDGNLHYNVSPAAEQTGPQHAAAFVALEEPMNRLVHDAVAAHGGSISAEHGLGVLRRDESARYKSAVELKLMRAVKAALDPRGLMNPGKVLE